AALPVAPGPPRPGPDLVGDEGPARLADDGQGGVEVLLGRRDEPADALDGLHQEGGDLAVGRALDERLQVLGAGDAAVRVLQVEVAAVTVGRVGVADAGDLALHARAVLLHAHGAEGERAAAAVIVAQDHQLGAAR